MDKNETKPILITPILQATVAAVVAMLSLGSIICQPVPTQICQPQPPRYQEWGSVTAFAPEFQKVLKRYMCFNINAELQEQILEMSRDLQHIMGRNEQDRRRCNLVLEINKLRKEKKLRPLSPTEMYRATQLEVVMTLRSESKYARLSNCNSVIRILNGLRPDNHVELPLLTPKQVINAPYPSKVLGVLELSSDLEKLKQTEELLATMLKVNPEDLRARLLRLQDSKEVRFKNMVPMSRLIQLGQLQTKTADNLIQQYLRSKQQDTEHRETNRQHAERLRELTEERDRALKRLAQSEEKRLTTATPQRIKVCCQPPRPCCISNMQMVQRLKVHNDALLQQKGILQRFLQDQGLVQDTAPAATAWYAALCLTTVNLYPSHKTDLTRIQTTRQQQS